MPIARIQMPDGRVARVEVPEGTTPEQATQYAQDLAAQPSVMDTVPSDTGVPASGATSRFLRGLGHGLKQPYVGAKQLLGMTSEEEVARQRQLHAPVLGTTAGKIGEFVGGAAPYVAASALLPGSSVLGAAVQQGALGGIQGALTPTAPGEYRSSNIGLGAAGGALAGAATTGLARFLTPVPGVPKERLAAAAKARAMGVQPRPSQITGSSALETLEQISGKTPAIDAANVAAINRQAAKLIGQPDATALTSDVIEAGYDDAARKLGELAQGSILNTTKPSYIAAVQKLQNEYRLLTPTNRAKIPDARNYINELVDWANRGSVDGVEYQANRSLIAKLARGPKTPQTHFYSQLVKAMDEAAPRGAEWDAVRKQYAMLKIFEKPNVTDAFGNVNGRALWGAASKSNFADLKDIAEVAKAFPPPVVKSGAPGVSKFLRGVTSTGISGATGAAGGSVGSYLYGARDPAEIIQSGLIGGGAGMVGGALLRQLLTNPATGQYLSKGLLGGRNLAPSLVPLSPFGAEYQIMRGRNPQQQ
jgi:hypothetical protein